MKEQDHEGPGIPPDRTQGRKELPESPPEDDGRPSDPGREDRHGDGGPLRVVPGLGRLEAEVQRDALPSAQGGRPGNPSNGEVDPEESVRAAAARRRRRADARPPWGAAARPRPAAEIPEGGAADDRIGPPGA